MKKLLRVKQLASENLGRAEKTEDLNDELQQIEKKIESIKHACQLTVKKLTACLCSSISDLDRVKSEMGKVKVSMGVKQGKVPKTEEQKRKRKLPEYGLATGMLEAASGLEDKASGCKPLLSCLFEKCAGCEMALAATRVEHEVSMEQEVVAPINSILDDEVKQITQARKALTKARLDMDSNKSRWTAAVKSAETDMTKTDKADHRKEKYEDSTTEFIQAQDGLVTEMLHFCSQEMRHASMLKRMLELQLDYHRQCVSVLEGTIPGVTRALELTTSQPVYGCSLEKHLQLNGREIAVVIEECIAALMEIGLETEGLFRLAGGVARVRKLKAMFNARMVDMSAFVTDVHAIAGALKLYLRELPEPLLTYELYDSWIKAGMMQDNDARLQSLWSLVQSLPQENLSNFRYLMTFFHRLSTYSDVNKMGAANIALVIGPNLLWSRTEQDNSTGMSDTTVRSKIIELIIEHFDWFFPEGASLLVLSQESYSSSQKSVATFPDVSTTNPKPMLRGSPTGSQPVPQPRPRTGSRPVPSRKPNTSAVFTSSPTNQTS
ncbi:rho GTPase-activating protein 17-like [Corticium candelabrum]|uniref:rho GTPase-activating protein 17-like n=1 Tax=Corticium candelabrum TaxID=121492 RepID=UPI002E30A7C2|nr:rho GTPase-activating protein 17-like [Corticium candelabrum]